MTPQTAATIGQYHREVEKYPPTGATEGRINGLRFGPELGPVHGLGTRPFNSVRQFWSENRGIAGTFHPVQRCAFGR